MIDAWSREMLRQQATEAWEEAKRLHRTAADLQAQSEQARRMTEDRRARRLAQQPAGPSEHADALAFRSWDARPPRRGATTRELEFLVDQAIRRSPNRKDRNLDGRGAGLAASVNLPVLLRLQHTLGRQLGFVVGAHDAGTALGLAIATQPDVAVVDARLDLATGADFALALPLYAPRTKTLLLTDDREMAAKAEVVGLDVLPRQYAEPDLLSWISAHLD
ncbi:MAG: hypothetical protein KGJ77_06415 [Acidobacteriota bacterium]|nr:hypothetical protein [Acidobacteriota bacterium]